MSIIHIICNRKYSFSEVELKNSVKESFSIAQTLKKLNIAPEGANYKKIKRLIKLLNIDTSHFTGQAHLRGKSHSWAKKIPLKEILVEQSSYTNIHRLKKRLIKENLIINKCAICSINSWLDKPITLHLDHQNGVNDDNRLENLRMLCPNCHSQTDTYAGKNKGTY